MTSRKPRTAEAYETLAYAAKHEGRRSLAAKPRMGRPPTDPATHYSEAFIVRVTPTERAAIEAARGSVTVGVWARGVLVKTAKRARR